MAAAKYPQTLRSASVTISTANTNLDGTSSVELIVGASTQTEVTLLDVEAIGATTAGWVRFWHFDGTTYVPIVFIPVWPWTPVNTFPQIPPWRALFIPTKPIVLASTSHKITCATHVAETFKVRAQGWDY